MSSGPDILIEQPQTRTFFGADGQVWTNAFGSLAVALLPNGEVVGVSAVGGANTARTLVVTEIDNDGQIIGQQTIGDTRADAYFLSAAIAVQPNGDFWVGLLADTGNTAQGGLGGQLTLAKLSPDGSVLRVIPPNTSGPYILPTVDGLLGYALGDGGVGFSYQQHLASGNNAAASTALDAPLLGNGNLYPGPHAYALTGPGAFVEFDNNLVRQFEGGHELYDTVLPQMHAGAHVVENSAATITGGKVVLAWNYDNGGQTYMAIYDPASHALGAPVSLGVVNQPRVIALWDGSFVVAGLRSYQTFDSTGTHGGGWVDTDSYLQGLNAYGQLVGFTADAEGRQVEHFYTIDSLPGSDQPAGGGDSVSVSVPLYYAPDGVTTITLTGSDGQTVYGNNGGDTVYSNNSGNVLVGGSGADTLFVGRGGDRVTGGAGADAFLFQETPWAASHITDFGVGQDHIDLGGLLARSGYTGGDAVAEGYLRIADDDAGDAVIWSNLDKVSPGLGEYAVAVLEGVSAASLSLNGALVTTAGGAEASPSHAVVTGDTNYVAAADVTSITLTGSQQHIDASATHGVTIASNDTGDVLIGGAGDDAFHLGRGGDWVAGGAGADTFAYAAIPWAGGGITDFNAAKGDKIDVSGLLSQASYKGMDPIGDGFLKFTSDALGNAEIWADYNQPGIDNWWLVATLDGVSTSSLHYSGGLIT